jgi:RNA polymerase sigma-70 factor (ECF subfamily)
MDSARSIAHPDARRRELVSLLEKAAAEDRASLRTLYEYTSAKLYGICLRLLRDEAEAQEVLQEVYLTVWRRAASFDASRASPITWLATIARNRSIDRLRTHQVPTEDLRAAANIPDGSPSSFQVLETKEDASRLRSCLEELETRTRTAIRAAFFDGATYPELADREGVPLPTMKSWIRRGLISLRGCLER